MFVLITYDVSVTTKAGQRRLRNIAKTCLDYGMRVQNSVFECEVSPDKWVELRHTLLQIMNTEEDSLRFYMLGAKGRDKIEHVGTKIVSDPVRDALII